MSDQFEVPEPIICSPYDEPAFHWRLEEGREPEKAPGRRPSHYFYRDPSQRNNDGEARGVAVPIPLVNQVRARLAEWRATQYKGATRTTQELLQYEGEPRVHLIVETKGYDELAGVKAAAAERWVAAVNADGQYGEWRYAMARKVSEVRDVLDKA
jgi:hypothetical protein